MVRLVLPSLLTVGVLAGCMSEPPGPPPFMVPGVPVCRVTIPIRPQSQNALPMESVGAAFVLNSNTLILTAHALASGAAKELTVNCMEGSHSTAYKIADDSLATSDMLTLTLAQPIPFQLPTLPVDFETTLAIGTTVWIINPYFVKPSEFFEKPEYMFVSIAGRVANAKATNFQRGFLLHIEAPQGSLQGISGTPAIAFVGGSWRVVGIVTHADRHGEKMYIRVAR
jgi:hypothetical protein